LEVRYTVEEVSIDLVSKGEWQCEEKSRIWFHGFKARYLGELWQDQLRKKVWRKPGFVGIDNELLMKSQSAWASSSFTAILSPPSLPFITSIYGRQ
jgi:hypothetical protein